MKEIEMSTPLGAFAALTVLAAGLTAATAWVLPAATLTFALLTAPAYAQETPSSDGSTGGGKHRKGTGQKTQDQQKKPTVDEKGYRAAIDRLPDQNFDPWHNTR
jgi:hypothetical protein